MKLIIWSWEISVRVGSYFNWKQSYEDGRVCCSGTTDRVLEMDLWIRFSIAGKMTCRKPKISSSEGQQSSRMEVIFADYFNIEEWSSILKGTCLFGQWLKVTTDRKMNIRRILIFFRARPLLAPPSRFRCCRYFQHVSLKINK